MSSFLIEHPLGYVLMGLLAIGVYISVVVLNRRWIVLDAFQHIEQECPQVLMDILREHTKSGSEPDSAVLSKVFGVRAVSNATHAIVYNGLDTTHHGHEIHATYHYGKLDNVRVALKVRGELIFLNSNPIYQYCYN